MLKGHLKWFYSHFCLKVPFEAAYKWWKYVKSSLTETVTMWPCVCCCSSFSCSHWRVASEPFNLHTTCHRFYTSCTTLSSHFILELALWVGFGRWVETKSRPSTWGTRNLPLSYQYPMWLSIQIHIFQYGAGALFTARTVSTHLGMLSTKLIKLSL